MLKLVSFRVANLILVSLGIHSTYISPLTIGEILTSTHKKKLSPIKEWVRKKDLITREDFSEHFLVAFNGMPRPCPQRRTEETEVTTGGQNPSGHNPHFLLRLISPPANISIS